MNVRIKFLGAAGSVTGSKYLLEVGEYRILVDCGLFQGLKELRLRNWEAFPIEPHTIDAVVITHAHIDHCGYLPRLFKEGFSGSVYCNSITAELIPIMLKDAAKLQEEEAAFARKKGYSKHDSPTPLFDSSDVELVLPKLQGLDFATPYEPVPGIQVSFRHAGHILGASIVEMVVKGDHQSKKIVFSGDLGPFNNPLHVNPELITEADILLVESTYGNKKGHNDHILTELHQLLNRCEDRGGSLVIPAFSVGRTQLMIYYFWRLRKEGKMPHWPVFVDSPMAISVTELYRKYSQWHRLRDDELDDGHYIFDNPYIHYIKDQAASRELNERRDPAIIISASGMVTGGRILHHLFHRLRRKGDTVLFTGYQAEGSRGRRILEGEKDIKIFGEQVPVIASIESIEGFSAHADKEDLFRWIEGFESSPKMTFIVHGEKEGAMAFKDRIVTEKQWNVFVPEYLESFQLFEGI